MRTILARSQILGIWGCFVFCATLASANSVEFIPLKKSPAAKDLTSVANGSLYGSENEKRPWLTEEQVRLFLDQGQLVNDYPSIDRYPKPHNGAEGLFCTKAEGIYEWKLLTPQVLKIFRFDNGHQETAILVLPENTSVSPGTAPAPPTQTLADVFRKTTIIDFTNGGPPSTGFRLRVEKSRISRFFEKGTASSGDRYGKLEIWDQGWVTIPRERLLAWTDGWSPENLANCWRIDQSQVRPAYASIAIDGVVLLSNGWIVHWRLWDDAALKLRDPWGREELVLLPPLAK